MSRLLLLLPMAWGAQPCARPGVSYASDAVPNAGFFSDSSGCAKSCGISPTCAAYTWKDTEALKGGCWHFASTPSEALVPGAVSGPKSCQDLGAAGPELQSVTDAVSAGVNGAVEGLHGGANDIAAAAGTKISHFGDVVTTGAGEAADAAAGAVNGASEGVASAANSVATGVSDTAAGATAGVAGAADAAATAVAGAELPDGVDAAAAAFITTPEPSPLNFKAKVKNAPLFTLSLVATVCVACFMRYLAHCFFNDRDQARREDQMMRRKNKASSTAPDDEDPPSLKSPMSPMGSLSRGLVQPGVTYSGSQPMIMSQAMPQPMQSYQAGSPMAYGPVTVAPQPTYIVG